MVINIPVIILELNDHLYLAGRHSASVTNTFKPDLISGLFGFNGTPMLAMFSCFFFIYDLWYYRNILNKRRKIPFLIYYFSMLAFVLYVSIPSDNKGLYIELAISFLIYLTAIPGGYAKVIERIKKRAKLLIILLIVFVVVIITYMYYSPFTYAVDQITYVLNKGYTMKSSGTGSAERFGIIYYFFSSNINKLTGAGIGTMEWKAENGFGFELFGQNDLGSFLVLGGVLFLIVIFCSFIYVWQKSNGSIKLTFLEFAFFLFLMIYTQPFTTTSIMISFVMLLSVCIIEKKQAMIKNEIRDLLI